MLRVVEWVCMRKTKKKKIYIYIYIVNLQPARSKFDSSN